MLMLLVQSAVFDISEHEVLRKEHFGVILSLLRSPEFHVEVDFHAGTRGFHGTLPSHLSGSVSPGKTKGYKRGRAFRQAHDTWLYIKVLGRSGKNDSVCGEGCSKEGKQTGPYVM